MCLIVALHRVHPVHSLVVAANRDERYDRPASPPQRLLDASGMWRGIVAGVDLQKGGSWLGATRGGFFVGLTNQRTFAPADRCKRSRGEVVLELLQLGSMPAAQAYLDDLDVAELNDFNLLFGDGQELEVAYGRSASGTVERHPLEPGVVVLSNDVLCSDDFPKAARATAAAERLSSLPWPQLRPALVELLADHTLPPEVEVVLPAGSLLSPAVVHQLQARCIHTPAYGTCSSTIVAVGGGSVSHYLFAEGSPCQAAFREYRQLFEAPA